MPAKLCYKDLNRWTDVPKWSEHFINIGEELALEGFESSSRVTTAIVVPSRGYCAALIGFGMIIGDTIIRDSPSKEAHFNKLLGLDPGTPVDYHETDKKIRSGVICHPEKRKDDYYIKFQITEPSKKGSGIFYMIGKERAFQLFPSTHSVVLPKRRIVREKRLHNEFVSNLLPGCDLINFDVQSKFVCAIVGKKNLLEQEIVNTPFAVAVDGGFAAGILQDVLRVNSFANGAQSNRSMLIPTGLRRQPSINMVEQVEMSVIFDGASAFLKWGALCPNRHRIIILDRTELYFNDAIHDINSVFSQNRINIENSVPFSALTPLPGTEIIAFREEIQ